MPLAKQETRRRLISAAALFILGTLFIIDSMTNVVVMSGPLSIGHIAADGFAAPFHMLLMVISTFTIMQLLRDKADGIALIGGALTILGWSAGIRILALRQLEALVRTGVTGLPLETFDRLFRAAPIIWKSIVPGGILFPLGMITLGATLFATRPIPRPIGLLMALGGILFPVGRIGRLAWAVVSCDVILGATFVLLGWQIARRRESRPPLPRYPD